MTKRVLILVAVVVLGAVVFALIPRGSVCADGARRLDAAFGPGRRERLLSQLGPTAAMPQVERLSRLVETARDSLGAAWANTCSRKDEAGKAAQLCLDDRLMNFEAIADALVSDAVDTRTGFTLAGRLDDVASCGTERLVRDAPPSDEPTVKAIRAARTQLASADALRLRGKHDEALAAAENALNQAHETHWLPVEAEAAFSVSLALRAKGRVEDAEAAFTRALETAEKSHHSELIIRLSAHRLTVAASRAAVADADLAPWRERAMTTLEVLPRPRLRAEVDVAQALVELARGWFNESESASTSALTWAKEHDAALEADVSTLRAQLFLQHGRFERAVEPAKTATRLRLELLGEKHPLTLQARITFAESLAKSGLCDDAHPFLVDVLDELRKRNDVSPLVAASALQALGVSLEGQGHVGDALTPTKEARELYASALGPRHRITGTAVRAVGERLRSMGRRAEAIGVFSEAIEIGIEASGPTHRDVLEAKAQRALTLAMDANADARSEASEVLSISEADPHAGDVPRLLARLAIAFLPDATPDERKAALDFARSVRGEKHPDVVRALLLQFRAKDAAAPNAGLDALTLFQKLQVKQPAYVPLSIPVPD